MDNYFCMVNVFLLDYSSIFNKRFRSAIGGTQMP
jgi:hypothetical protein